MGPYLHREPLRYVRSRWCEDASDLGRPAGGGVEGSGRREAIADALGGDEGETAHAPCVRRGGVNGYSHLLNGSAEACLQPSRVGDASMMLNEDMGSSGNHFGSSLVTSTFAAARSAAAHGDDFTAFLRLHTLVTFLHLLLFPF